MAEKKSDLDNNEHEPDADAKKVILFGKTSGGSYIPFLVDNDGVLGVVS